MHDSIVPDAMLQRATVLAEVDCCTDYAKQFALIEAEADTLSYEGLLQKVTQAVNGFVQKTSSGAKLSLLSSLGIKVVRTELQQYMARFADRVFFIEKLPYNKVSDLVFHLPTGMRCTYKSSVDTLTKTFTALAIEPTLRDIDAAMVKLLHGIGKRDPKSFAALEPVLKNMTKPTRHIEDRVGEFLIKNTDIRDTEAETIEGYVSDVFTATELRDIDQTMFMFDPAISVEQKFRKAFDTMYEYTDTRNSMLGNAPNLVKSNAIEKQVRKISVVIADITTVLESNPDVFDKASLVWFGATVQILAIRLRLYGFACAASMKLEHNYVSGTEALFANLRGQ